MKSNRGNIMSRTIRAKNHDCSHYYSYTEEEFHKFYFREGEAKWHRLPNNFKTYREYLKYEYAYSHSEGGRKYYFHSSVPSGFRRGLNQEFRAKARLELKVALIGCQEEDFVYSEPKRLRNALWLWD